MNGGLRGRVLQLGGAAGADSTLKAGRSDRDGQMLESAPVVWVREILAPVAWLGYCLHTIYRVVPNGDAYVEGFRAALDLVAREHHDVAFVDAPPQGPGVRFCFVPIRRP